MKISRIKILCIMFLLLFVMLITAVFGDGIKLYMTNSVSNVNDEVIEEDINISDVGSSISGKADKADISNIAVKIEREEVYAGLTIEELTLKLNRYLKDKGALANQGSLIATQSLAMGVDPYVAVAIMMHETGCNNECSRLVKNKNNVGGMRGRSGRWQSFATLEDGINGFLSNLSRNYYKKGLNTPEKMAKKYAGGSTSWAGKIRNYMAVIERV
ncbi:MAG: hypothetical protein E7162_03370 [Firmicutes bacterium]|nr:hypothetical protein [Bacillota bacterium]